MEEWRRDYCVDPFVWAYIGTVSATEIEERLPADKAPRSSGAATQVHRVGAALPRRIENHAEEWLAVITVEIGAVRRPHHAVPKAVGDLELYRNKRVAM